MVREVAEMEIVTAVTKTTTMTDSEMTAKMTGNIIMSRIEKMLAKAVIVVILMSANQTGAKIMNQVPLAAIMMTTQTAIQATMKKRVKITSIAIRLIAV
jgi:hypothetical protein